ncbi:inositol hexakisphosphate and diphosphoinositol-pentakisphosphate kinase [Umbelopsis sp. WA50703]
MVKLPELDVVGVCALDTKARSKPMRNILNRLLEYGDFETVIFGDNVILHEDVEDWPYCDFLISFFSNGFPLDKAIAYTKLHNPFLVNSLEMQILLWDRRLVLSLLDKAGVPTPKRLTVSRDGGPRLPEELAQSIEKAYCINLNLPAPEPDLSMPDEDTIQVNGQVMQKPFVEKPVDGENHNINIYYDTAHGGGGRRLFRKVGNKSSEFDKDLTKPRTEGSYIYEQFMSVDNAEDVKVYTIGPDFVHAETRKSPVVDGVVRRNTDGKEVRYITELSREEKEMARKVTVAFGQTICGFDLLRVDGKSYVIDVNGWSFVKGNEYYYDNCAKILSDMFHEVIRKKWRLSPILEPRPSIETSFENTWRLKGFLVVFRHADRTPKQKMKFTFKSQPFVDLLEGSTEEVILRQEHQLKLVATATAKAIEMGSESRENLLPLKEILDNKSSLPGTKVQLKPTFSKHDGKLQKLQLIVKWGGEFTHAALHQSRDLGDNMRKDIILMNRQLLDNVKIYTSSERRVRATADVFASSFLNTTEIPEDMLVTSKALLDDSNAAKEPMDRAKAELRVLLEEGNTKYVTDYMWPDGMPEPRVVVEKVIATLTRMRETMRKNWTEMDVENIQTRWCCHETANLFRERWEKLFKECCDVERGNWDPSKVSELYDSLKYDALHNRPFLETIFVDPTAKEGEERSLDELKDLFKMASALFDLIAPQEYGVNAEEKLEIGLLTSLPLLKKILSDLEDIKTAEGPRTRFYFTKESHVHTLLNVVFQSDLPTLIKRNDIPELDYLTQITFELYERNNNPERRNSNSPVSASPIRSSALQPEKEYSLRISYSPGANYPNIMDLQMDAKHCLNVARRQVLTDFLPFNRALSSYKQHFKYSRIDEIERIIEERRYHYAQEDETDEVGEKVICNLGHLAGSSDNHHVQ